MPRQCASHSDPNLNFHFHMYCETHKFSENICTILVDEVPKKFIFHRFQDCLLKFSCDARCRSEAI